MFLQSRSRKDPANSSEEEANIISVIGCEENEDKTSDAPENGGRQRGGEFDASKIDETHLKGAKSNGSDTSNYKGTSADTPSPEKLNLALDSGNRPPDNCRNIQPDIAATATVPPTTETTAPPLQQENGIPSQEHSLSPGSEPRRASVGVQTDTHTELPLTGRPPLVPTVLPPTVGQLSASVAIQCSFPMPSSLALHNKSTQTLSLSAALVDMAVQTTEAVDTDSKLSDDSDEVRSTGAPEEHSSQHATDVSSEMPALRKELESLQNTVTWQALMLRLYSMH